MSIIFNGLPLLKKCFILTADDELFNLDLIKAVFMDYDNI